MDWIAAGIGTFMIFAFGRSVIRDHTNSWIGLVSGIIGLGYEVTKGIRAFIPLPFSVGLLLSIILSGVISSWLIQKGKGLGQS